MVYIFKFPQFYIIYVPQYTFLGTHLPSQYHISPHISLTELKWYNPHFCMFYVIAHFLGQNLPNIYYGFIDKNQF